MLGATENRLPVCIGIAKALLCGGTGFMIFWTVLIIVEICLAIYALTEGGHEEAGLIFLSLAAIRIIIIGMWAKRIWKTDAMTKRSALMIYGFWISILSAIFGLINLVVTRLCAKYFKVDVTGMGLLGTLDLIIGLAYVYCFAVLWGCGRGPRQETRYDQEETAMEKRAREEYLRAIEKDKENN